MHSNTISLLDNKIVKVGEKVLIFLQISSHFVRHDQIRIHPRVIAIIHGHLYTVCTVAYENPGTLPVTLGTDCFCALMCSYFKCENK